MADAWWVGLDREKFSATARDLAEARRVTPQETKKPYVATPRVVRPPKPTTSLSATSRYAERRRAFVARGLCPCGRKRQHYTYRCDACQLAVRRSNRNGKGHKEWKPGSAGRKPVLVVQEAR